jgi:hypothetical protein
MTTVPPARGYVTEITPLSTKAPIKKAERAPVPSFGRYRGPLFPLVVLNVTTAALMRSASELAGAGGSTLIAPWTRLDALERSGATSQYLLVASTMARSRAISWRWDVLIPDLSSWPGRVACVNARRAAAAVPNLLITAAAEC